MTQEIWKRVDFHATEPIQLHYEISNFGRIKSFQGSEEGEILQGSVIQGYKSLNIRFKGKSFNNYLHKLIALYFIEKQNQDEQYIIHLDFDKLNNHISNLKWVNRSDLNSHNKKNPNIVNRLRPIKAKNYKLNEAKVLMIKKMLQNEKSRTKMIAKQFGITSTQVNRIKTGENWKHVHLDKDKK